MARSSLKFFLSVAAVSMVATFFLPTAIAQPIDGIDGRFVWGEKEHPPPTERTEAAVSEILAGCPSKVVICVGVASGGHERDDRTGPNVGDHAWARGRKDACVEAVQRNGGRAIGMPVGLQGVGGQSGRGFLAWCVPGRPERPPEPEEYGTIVDEGIDPDNNHRNYRWTFTDGSEVTWSVPPDWQNAFRILDKKIPPRVRVTGSIFLGATGMYADGLRFIGGAAGAQILVGIELDPDLELLFRAWLLGFTTFGVVEESNAGLRAGVNAGLSPDQHVDIWFGGSGCFSGSHAWSGTNYRCWSADTGLTVRPLASLDGDRRGKGHILYVDAMVGAGETWSAITGNVDAAVNWVAFIGLDFLPLLAPETETGE